MWELIGIVAAAVLSNFFGRQREGEARQENYKYNEMAAENQDTRQRALFGDLYSPEAQLQQIKNAGLSTSLFYSGGTAGSSGVSAPISGGAAGIAPTVYGVQAEQLANIKNVNADTNLKNAEANKLNKDAERTQLQNDYQKMVNTIQKIDNIIGTMMVWDYENGTESSIYEMAGDSKNFDEFLTKVRDAGKVNVNQDTTEFLQATQTERGVEKLRNVYLMAQSFDTEIEILASDKVSAEFNKQVMQVLNNSEFAQLNKDAAIQYLKTNIATGNLTEEQKNAWNNILRRLEKKAGADTKDIIVVLGMMLNNAMSNWHMPNINISNRTNAKVYGGIHNP